MTHADIEVGKMLIGVNRAVNVYASVMGKPIPKTVEDALPLIADLDIALRLIGEAILSAMKEEKKVEPMLKQEVLDL